MTSVQDQDGVQFFERRLTIEILAHAFLEDPLHRYVLSQSKFGRTLSAETNAAFFEQLLSELEDEGVHCLTDENQNYAVVCMYEPVPEKKEQSNTEDSDSLSPALDEMALKSGNIIATVASPGERVLHIFLVGKTPQPPSNSNISVKGLLKNICSMAFREGCSVYLEATSNKSREIYRACGFQDVGAVRIGDGEVDEEGRSDASGIGVEIHVMFLPFEGSGR